MLVFLHPRVLSRVAGFPVASPCLWGKLENMSFSNVSKQVVMSFCVAGMALCDIPTCLITCRKYQIGGSLARNARFFAPTCLVSSLWFSCGVAVSMWEAPLHSTLHNLHFRPHTLHFTLHTLHFALYTPHSSPETLHSTLHTLHYTLHFPLLTPHSTHFTLHTLHFALHTPHFTLHTPYFTFHTSHSTLSTPHSTL